MFRRINSLIAAGPYNRWCSTTTGPCSSLKSALFVPGNVGAIVTPTVIPLFNVAKRIKSEETILEMEDNLVARNIRIENLDLSKCAEGLEYLSWIEEGILRCGQKREKLSENVKEATEEGKEVDEEWITELTNLKNTLRGLTRDKWKLEETVVMNCLNLPNRLHPDTPKDPESEKVIHEVGHNLLAGKDCLVGHQKLCENYLAFDAESSFYLFGDLAGMELELSHQAIKHLLEFNFEMVSGSDFARSSVVEGCHPNSNICQEESKKALALAATSDFGGFDSGMGTYLVGSASVYHFVGFLVKYVLMNPVVLPLTYFSCGKRYARPARDVKSLFHTHQASTVELFAACRDEGSMEAQFNHLLMIMKKFYDRFNVHYRIVISNAKDLEHSQSKKVSVQMYSTSERAYVEVGHLCLYDEFLSERLMLMYEATGNGDSESRPFYIVGGTLIKIPSVIGCLVENSQTADGNYDLSQYFI